MFMGPDVLKEVIEKAELYPIKGLFSFRDYYEEIDSYYHQTLGYELGVSTGWMALNELYNICGGSPLAKALDHEVVPGELTIVTGVPNSGKSEWIDALLCNLNERVGWKFALCSMENKYILALSPAQPDQEHQDALILIGLAHGKPFVFVEGGSRLNISAIGENFAGIRFSILVHPG
ncbi:unnamed protein product [Ilex paraguariensis]|uniref:SF4 helicase domain-containing protein n=1 Tax=Ilex paraguariensis TaxID=185542 RepID=A0ABC8UPB4_9AQUA